MTSKIQRILELHKKDLKTTEETIVEIIRIAEAIYLPHKVERYTQKTYSKNTLFAFARFAKASKEGISVQELFDIYQDLTDKQLKGDIKEYQVTHIEGIEQTTLSVLGITLREYKSKNKYGNIPAARQIVALISLAAGYTEHQVADATGESRISIHHRKKAAINWYNTEEAFRDKVNKIAEIHNVGTSKILKLTENIGDLEE